MSSTAGPAGTPSENSTERDGKWKHSFNGPLGKIRETIKDHKHKKWGLLMYRCDYASNDTWTKFLAAIDLEMEKELDLLQGEDLKDTFEMTPKEDKHTLDGATVDQVRDIFQKWVQSDEAKAENGSDANATFNYPRYTYCVHVDADVLDAVVNRGPGLSSSQALRTAYVNLVQLRPEGDPGYIRNPEYLTDEEINEENEEDMDYVKVPLDYIGAESYNALYDPQTFDRYARYREGDDLSIG